MVSLVVDGREPAAVFRAFENVPHARLNLDVGDFQITKDDVPVVIAERKTLSDFVSSLTGSRMSDQTARLMDKCKDTGARPLLIIEHAAVFDWNGKIGSLSRKFVDCCIQKYCLEGVSVLRTKSVEHTRDVVAWILKRCEQDKIPTFEPSLNFRGEAGEKKYRRKDYSKPWHAMLTAVPGVSKAKAMALSEKYPNPRSLIKKLEDGGDRKLGIKGIGKKLEQVIREVFCE